MSRDGAQDRALWARALDAFASERHPLGFIPITGEASDYVAVHRVMAIPASTPTLGPIMVAPFARTR